MTDFITVLTSKGPLLTKRWTPAGIEPYDRAKNFTAEAYQVDSVRDLSRVLAMLEEQPRRCVIRGQHLEHDAAGREHCGPVDTTRDLEAFDERSHRWVCLDVDGWVMPEGIDLDDPAQAVLSFVQDCLPAEFQEITHHWQLSSSAGAPGKEHLLKAHIWFWLDAYRTGQELDGWARALQLPVDITVFRTVQVHYTAAPVIDPGVSCPIGTRSGLTEGILGDEVSLVMPDVLDLPRVERVGRSGMVDPRTKPGLIGAFCRAYPPHRVVTEILPEVFEFEGDSGARLTWLQGGGSPGGACITDDELRIYNSHATDPFEGHAQNMWDLVRHFKFGDLDKDIDPEAVEFAGPSVLPSHQAMARWVRELDDVAAELQAAADEREQEEQEEQERERQERLDHLQTLRAGVLGCSDVEALKVYLKDVLRKDDIVDDTDRNGALTVAVQERFKDLGSPQKREDVRRLLRPVTAPSSSGSSGPDWLSRWAYITDSDRFFNLDSKTTVTGRGFDAINSHHMPLAQDGVHRESAADYAINVWRIQEVKQSLYAPGQGEVFDMLGVTWANDYREDTVPAAGPGGEAAIKMVQLHLQRLFPDQREREILLSWMAHNVRHPGRKIRWAPYLYGAQGTGKTFIGELLGMVMGEANTRVLAGSTIQSAFNGWSTGHALVTIEEVYQVGHLFETEEKLKAPIANNTIDVHRKGRDSYRAPNFTNYLLLSNHPDGMPIGEGDRRFFFLQCALTAEEAKELAEEGYFDSLFDACRTSVPGLRRWLLQEVQPHPEFDPDGRAPGTEAKRQVIEMSKTDAEVFIEDFLAGKNETTTSRVAAKLEAAGIEGVRSRGLSKLLERRRFQFFKIMRVGGVPARVYVRANTAARTEDAVRNALMSQVDGEFDNA